MEAWRLSSYETLRASAVRAVETIPLADTCI